MVYEIETVIDDTLIGGNYNEDTEMAINSPNVRLVNNSKDFDGVCFNYALNNFHIWCCENAYDELELAYIPITIKEAREGDIISYHEINDFNSKYEKPCGGNSTHFAIIKETDNTLDGTIITSKWGCDGIFRTNLYDVPDIYGNSIVIWREK